MSAKSEKKSVLVRMSGETYERLRQRAQDNGMSMNSWILHAAAGESPRSTAPSAYASLTNEVQVLNYALQLSGLDENIKKARALLGGEE